MKKYIFAVLSIIFISACSMQLPPNHWQHQSAVAFNAYVKDFMYGDDALAKNDLKRAVKHAKKSADLNTLAKIYLGKCALNISVGIEDNCNEYQSIASLVDDEALSHYYGVITKTSSQSPDTILNTNKATSILLNGALKKDVLSDIQRAKLLEVASYNGYKRAALFWLHESKSHTDESSKKEFYQQKIDAMQ